MKTKIIYHEADLDGNTSAAIFLLQMSTFDEEPDLVPYDYHKDFNQRIVNGNVVYMVDVSLKPAKLLEVSKLSAEFYLLDHHVSFYNDLLAYCESEGIDYVRSPFGVAERIEIKSCNFTFYYTEKLSGCELTAKLFGNGLNEKSKELVQILGQYDTWRQNSDKKFIDDKDWDNVVLPIQYALRSYMDPVKLARILYSLDNKGDKYNLDVLIRDGKAILNYLKVTNKRLLETYSFTFEMNGLRLLAMNTHNFTSFTFEDFWNEDLFDAMLAFCFTGKQWKLSLYTTKTDSVDILKIAKFFGGGGHKGACGFQIPHNQLVFRSGKLEMGVMTVVDMAMLPATYKGTDIKEIIKYLKDQPLTIENKKPEIPKLNLKLDIKEIPSKNFEIDFNEPFDFKGKEVNNMLHPCIDEAEGLTKEAFEAALSKEKGISLDNKTETEGQEEEKGEITSTSKESKPKAKRPSSAKKVIRKKK